MRRIKINRRRTSTIVKKCSDQTDPKGDFQFYSFTCFIRQEEDVKVNLRRNRKNVSKIYIAISFNPTTKTTQTRQLSKLTQNQLNYS